MRTRAVLFDAYGTLFDVHSVIACAEQLFPGQGAALSQAWRTKQLEYTWLRTLSGQYRDFWQVTGDALTWAARSLRLHLPPQHHARLLDAYLTLRPFPENVEVLGELYRRGVTLGTLSNGTPAMLRAAIASAGMQDLLLHVLSIDAVKRYKTDPAAYALGTAASNAPAADLVFVSSNCWDAVGATWFGYRTFWVNRSGAPMDEMGILPTGTGTTLADLLPFVD